MNTAVCDESVLAVRSKDGNIIGIWVYSEEKRAWVLHGIKELTRDEIKDLFNEFSQ